MSAREQTFVRDIQADPLDDGLRQVYADWLEEQGRENAADFLRTELLLAGLPSDAPQAASLRTRLWGAWATVDADWLWTFTQPRVLRANPTPFPEIWKNFALGKARPHPNTYGQWPYESIPPLPTSARDSDFRYMGASRRKARKLDLAPTIAAAREQGVELPASFVTFFSGPALARFRFSATDCYFATPSEWTPVSRGPLGDGVHVNFYRDSQDCVHWDLYLHPSGAHCVIARWSDYLVPDEPAEAEQPADPDPAPHAWFVAPSFDAFVYRIWIENQVWLVQHADYVRSTGEEPPAITPEMQAYLDHYSS